MAPWWLIIIAFVGALLVLLVLRVPVAFALAGMTLILGVVYYGFEASGRLFTLSVMNTLVSFNLVPIALFMFMGDLLFRSGIASRSIQAVAALFPRFVPARTGLLTTTAGALFGMMSGSTIANTALLGRTYLTDMRREGYKDTLAMGTIIAAGGLAMILPPSTLVIVWGATAGVSIGPLLIAGIIPGLLMATGYAIVTMIWGGPLGGAPKHGVASDGKHEEIAPLGQRIRDGIIYVLPMAAVVVTILGAIFLGIATPAESAALGVFVAFILVLVYRKFSWSLLGRSAYDSAKISAMILLIMGTSGAYSQLLSFSGATGGFINAVTSLAVPPLMLLILIQVVLFVMGMFLEQISIMLITLPLLMPIVSAMGWDPVWFGMVMLLNLQIGTASPPFGMGLFVMKGVAGRDVRMTRIYRAAIPFIGSDIAVMALLIAVPTLVTVLPAAMGY